jgi:hypothetical protein
MKVIFADPTPRWVPFAAAALIVVGVWGALVWQNLDIVFPTRFAVGLGSVLFVAIFFQGRFYWKDEVAKLTSTDGGGYQATTAIWVGRGKVVSFGAQEAKDWSASAKSGTPEELSSVKFSVRGTPLAMSFVNPKRVDLAGLSALNPEFFAKLAAEYPTLKDVTA